MLVTDFHSRSILAMQKNMENQKSGAAEVQKTKKVIEVITLSSDTDEEMDEGKVRYKRTKNWIESSFRTAPMPFDPSRHHTARTIQSEDAPRVKKIITLDEYRARKAMEAGKEAEKQTVLPSSVTDEADHQVAEKQLQAENTISEAPNDESET